MPHIRSIGSGASNCMERIVLFATASLFYYYFSTADSFLVVVAAAAIPSQLPAAPRVRIFVGRQGPEHIS